MRKYLSAFSQNTSHHSNPKPFFFRVETMKYKVVLENSHVKIVFPTITIKLHRKYVIEEKGLIYNPLTKMLIPIPKQ